MLNQETVRHSKYKANVAGKVEMLSVVVLAAAMAFVAREAPIISLDSSQWTFFSLSLPPFFLFFLCFVGGLATTLRSRVLMRERRIKLKWKLNRDK